MTDVVECALADGWKQLGYISDEGFASGGLLADSPALGWGGVTTTWSHTVEAPESWRCPHCNRDWHTEPLRQAVARMWDSHKFDLEYDPDADESPVECVGSDVYGPPRQKLSRTGTYIYSSGGMSWAIENAYTAAVAYTTDMLATVAGFSWPKLEWPTYSYSEWFAGEPEPPCEPVEGDLGIEFGPEHWPVEHAEPTTKALALIEKAWDTVQQLTAEIPVPESPGMDFTAQVEKINNQYAYPTMKGNKK